MNTDEIIYRIGYFRNKLRLSARDLSLMIGKNGAYINHLENKEFGIKLSVLFEIIEALGVSCDEFFAKDFTSYQQNKELAEKFEALSPENKNLVLNLIKTMK